MKTKFKVGDTIFWYCDKDQCMHKAVVEFVNYAGSGYPDINYEVKYENNQLKIKRENEKEEIIDTSEFGQSFVTDILMRVNSHALYQIAKNNVALKWSSKLKNGKDGGYQPSKNAIFLNRAIMIDSINTDYIVLVIEHESGHLFDCVGDKETVIKYFQDKNEDDK